MATIASTNRFSSSSDPCTDESDDGDLVADLPAFMTSSSSSSKREIRSKRGTVRGFENKVSTSLAALQKRATDETQSSRVLRLMEVGSRSLPEAETRRGPSLRIVVLGRKSRRRRARRKDRCLHDEPFGCTGDLSAVPGGPVDVSHASCARSAEGHNAPRRVSRRVEGASGTRRRRRAAGVRQRPSRRGGRDV